MKNTDTSAQFSLVTSWILRHLAPIFGKEVEDKFLFANYAPFLDQLNILIEKMSPIISLTTTDNIKTQDDAMRN